MDDLTTAPRAFIASARILDDKKPQAYHPVCGVDCALNGCVGINLAIKLSNMQGSVVSSSGFCSMKQLVVLLFIPR